MEKNFINPENTNENDGIKEVIKNLFSNLSHLNYVVSDSEAMDYLTSGKEKKKIFFSRIRELIADLVSSDYTKFVSKLSGRFKAMAENPGTQFVLEGPPLLSELEEMDLTKKEHEMIKNLRVVLEYILQTSEQAKEEIKKLSENSSEDIQTEETEAKVNDLLNQTFDA